jgi:predicted nucleotidyltransferase
MFRRFNRERMIFAMTVDKVPESLLHSIVAEFAPQRVILFGSAARDEAHPESDLDLLVVLDDDVPLEKLGAKAVYAARGGFRRSVDIIPCRASVLEKRARAIGSFAHIVLRDGVTIYERPRAA